jgi:hypothetical protein
MQYRELLQVRRLYGGVYTTTFEDGLIVPWKPLSLGEFIQYELDVRRGLVPMAQLEDEIFCKCVVSQEIVDRMGTLLAGVIATVVQNIWQYSGPTSGEAFGNDLQQARDLLFKDTSTVIHQCAQQILTAFPYRPEEVYALDYETFLKRLAQAEAKLIDMKVLTEPIKIVPNQERDAKLADLNKKPKPRVDAKQLWEEQRTIQMRGQTTQSHGKAKQPTSSTPPPLVKIPPGKQEKWWKTSPVLEAKHEHTIQFQAEAERADEVILDNHERAEPKEMREYLLEQKLGKKRAKMVESAQEIYGPLLAELEKRRK